MKNGRNIFIFSLLLLFCNSTAIFSQFNRTKNWVLGDSVLIDFNTNPPTLGVSGLQSHEGVSVISDLNGVLLFYTNGITVWNAQHQPMPNGQGLNSDLSTSDAAVIVPLPGNNHVYYVFTVGVGAEQPLGSSIFGGVAYSIVDMSLNGGLGDVTQKNVVIHPSPLSTEKLCATQHANGVDYWIMTHDYGNNQFRAFLLTSAGILPNPVISRVGRSYTDQNGLFGNMRFSPSGCKLAVSLLGGLGVLDTLEVFDFDKNTGYVHNAMQLNFLGGWGQWGELPEDYPSDLTPYGVCFSPDNTKLYVSAPRSIVQFDLSSNNQQHIQQSRFPVAQTTSIGTSYYKFWSMQIDANEKIYVARGGASFISAINNPNNAGVACNFTHIGFSLQQLSCRLGLPNVVSNFLVTDSVTTCNPYCPELNLGKDTILCSADSLLIALDLPQGSIVWNNLDTSFSFTITSSGVYTAIYNFSNCLARYDTIEVTFLQNTLPDFHDTVFCKGDTLSFSLPIENETSYLLNNASIEPLFAIDTAGSFTITAEKESCVFSTTFNVVDICDTLVPPPLDTFDVVIPNVFTPNNDGENDVFSIQQKMVREFTFVIYNRWGKEVHRMQTFPTQNEIIIWDGKNVSDGTYFYTATFVDMSYKIHEKKGFITVFN